MTAPLYTKGISVMSVTHMPSRYVGSDEHGKQAALRAGTVAARLQELPPDAPLMAIYDGGMAEGEVVGIEINLDGSVALIIS
jgi:hypothetical protein